MTLLGGRLKYILFAILVMPIKKQHGFQYVPLSTAFFVSGLLGFLVSAVYLPKFDMTWAFALGTVFMVMVAASVLSMLKAAPGPQLK